MSEAVGDCMTAGVALGATNLTAAAFVVIAVVVVVAMEAVVDARVSDTAVIRGDTASDLSLVSVRTWAGFSGVFCRGTCHSRCCYRPIDLDAPLLLLLL